MNRILSIAALVIFALSIPRGARAQGEITVIAPGGLRAAGEQLIAGFERKTGYKVNATFGMGNALKQQIANGATCDVPIVQPPYPEVVASGNVVKSSETPLATVAVAVAVKKGAPRPDISTPESIKKMLLAAKSVATPDPSTGAASAASIDETFRKLGIADQMQPKLKRAPTGGAAMKMVANGEVEIGLTFLSEMSDPGIDIVGSLPAAISTRTGLVGFVSAHAKNPEGAKALLSYLSSPEAAAVYKSLGMMPGR